MKKISIQLFGGRGAYSHTGASSKSGGKAGYHDVTAKYGHMSLHEFEDAIRNKKTEFAGYFDKNGKMIVAVTSGNKSSVAVPVNNPRFGETYTATHNHPIEADRPIGGTFSSADIRNMLTYGHHEKRAVAGGNNEYTYIMRAGNKANYTEMRKTVATIDAQGKLNEAGRKGLNKAKKQFAKKGKKMTSSQANQIYIGSIKKVWKDVSSKHGFEYIEIKKPH